MRLWQIVILGLAIVSSPLKYVYGWGNNITHPALTERAVIGSEADSFIKTYLDLPGGLYNEIPHYVGPYYDLFSSRNALEWLMLGSKVEDAPILRTLHHFHDPTRNSGLDNTEVVEGWNGQSAVIWGLTGIGGGSYPVRNQWSWNDIQYGISGAREYYLNSLTEINPDWRSSDMALMFYSLGHVIHLVQDMGVPAHTRNDSFYAHIRPSWKDTQTYNPLERWVEKLIQVNGNLDRWISPAWIPTPKVFTTAKTYFDSDSYTQANNLYKYPLSNYVAPSDSALNNWGLSEKTNYQFFSWSTISGSDLYYFPHPLPFPDAGHDGGLRLENKRVYLYGYEVDHLAGRTTSVQKLAHSHLDKSWNIIGEAIYDDYATITLPRAIEYSTGLINYFFRGKIELRSWVESWNDDLLNVTLYVKNKSMLEANPLDYQFGFKGGTFEVYWEDASNVRHNVPNLTFGKTWNEASTLAYNEEMSIKFDDTPGNDLENAVRFIVVYKGNIVKQPEYTIDTDDMYAIATNSIETSHIHNIGTTILLLARFEGVNEDWFDPAEQFNNHGFMLAWYESWSRWEANPSFDGRQISIATTFQNNRDRIFVDVEDDWNGNRIFHSGGWDHLEYFPHAVENDCDIGTWCDGGYDGTCTVSIWNIPIWESGINYTEGDQVGWDSPEGDCFEVYTCTLAHTSAPANQPDVSGNYWLVGYPDVKTDLDIVGVSESMEESPGGTITAGGSLVNIQTMIFTYWPPDVWTNELNRGTATLEVVTGTDKIRIWDNPGKTGQPVIEQGNAKKVWQLISDTVPINLYVEGLIVSQSSMDVRLKFTLDYANVKVFDKVNFTVQN